MACDNAGGDFALHTPVMADKAADRAALLWQPSGPSPSCLQYWQLGTEASSTSKLACAPAGEMQRVLLSGLQAETDYAYRVVPTEETSDNKADKTNASARRNRVHQFRTGSRQEQILHFAVMGDSHGNHEVLRGLLTRAMQETPNLDFLLHVGDAVDDGKVAGSWYTDFVDPARDFLAAVPVHVAMGNHEKGETPPFQDPVASKTTDSFVSGNAFIVLVNSNLSLAPDGREYQEVEERLSSPEAQAATWKFVAFHHPPFAGGWGSCDGYDGDVDVREHLAPLMSKLGVDMVFNGHVHGYERGTWQGVTYLTTGGGGGALDHACTSWPHIVVSNYAHHVLNVDIEGPHLSVKAQGLDGNPIDWFTLDK